MHVVWIWLSLLVPGNYPTIGEVIIMAVPISVIGWTIMFVRWSYRKLRKRLSAHG